MNIDIVYELSFKTAQGGMLLAGGDGRISDADDPADHRPLLGHATEEPLGSAYRDASGPVARGGGPGEKEVALRGARRRVAPLCGVLGIRGGPAAGAPAAAAEAPLRAPGKTGGVGHAT